MTMFIDHCQNVFKDLESVEKRIKKFTGQDSARGSERQESKKQVCEMKQLILQAGFHFLFSNNPNVQYGIARYRRTSRDVAEISQLGALWCKAIPPAFSMHKYSTITKIPSVIYEC